ncbi:MAG: PIN domain-containing protein [Microcoleaceae cyanobacterium]
MIQDSGFPKTDSIKVVIPSICCMESFSELEDERRRRNNVDSNLSREIQELKGNIESEHSREIRKSLQNANFHNAQMANEIKTRLFEVLDWVASYVELIELTSSILRESLKERLIGKDETDNLILHCILNHAKASSDDNKVLLSGNSRDFGTKEIKQVLKEAGIPKYVASTKDLLGWLSSISSSD